MDARQTRRLARGAAILVIAIMAAAYPAPAASARNGIRLARAEAAARDAVVEHRSYRTINSTRTGLVTRGCWRAPSARVRCSLYVVVPSPCALGRGDLCAEALWERRWLVEVRRAQGGLAARILRISSGPWSR
jgi:hypothetical protein